MNIIAVRRLPFCLSLLISGLGFGVASSVFAWQVKQDFRPDDPKDAPPVFRASVDLVLVPVTVTDRLNRYIVDLEAEHFQVYENKVEQEILYFGTGKSPVSVGFILDISASMRDNILSARNAIVRFLEQGDPRDEFFLVTFNNRTAIALDFTPRGSNVRDKIVFANPKGSTALFDAVYVGLEKMRDAMHPKRALIVVTDGEDNRSRYTFSELREMARESPVQIYVIGEKGEVGYGAAVIKELVRISGGRPFFPTSLQQLDYFADLIHIELRSQYVLGYRSTDRRRGDGWRKIKVKLNPSQDLPPKLRLRHKPGYVPSKF
ncbi:MAG: VWA domain-containing protein [Acidobacteriota bacterium]